MRIGGYKNINIDSEEVQKAAMFALDEIKRLDGSSETKHLQFLDIVKAESQVVAGINYRITFEARQGNTGEKNTFDVEIYKDLSQNYELVSWN
mmetsp:Transcript_11309/g.16751  ORF Transcript_11309/g.16751 Transcript_11309/m.16751 type:complete len:93 (+) Transcript_11309:66-344(+)